jgi:hypothetical protein
MPTTGIRAEDKLIDLFLKVYNDCSWSGPLSVKVSPERTTDGAVEMLATRVSDGLTLAIEHTLIEPFVGEKIDFHSHYLAFARQLKADESLRVPGFSIEVEAPVHVLPRGSDWQAIIGDVCVWLRADGLSFPQKKELRECSCPHHPDGKLIFRVRTTPLDDPREAFLIVQRYGELRVGESVNKALGGKVRKLVRTKVDRRLLILERDQPWVLPEQIYEEVERLRPQFPDLALVDEIWIADTATFSVEKNYLCLSNREGGLTEESFSFDKGRLQDIARRGMTVYTASQGWWYDPNRPLP